MHTSSGPCALHTVCTGTPSYARALAVCTNLAGVHEPGAARIPTNGTLVG